MSDEEFQRAVLERLADLQADIGTRFDKVDRRMDAIAARMDDVENRIEDVAGRLGLLQSTVSQVVASSTRALDSIATLSSRVTKLENPDG